MSFGGIHPFLLRPSAGEGGLGEGGDYIIVWNEDDDEEVPGTIVTGTDFKYAIFTESVDLQFKENGLGYDVIYCLIAGGGCGGVNYHCGGGGGGAENGADGFSNFFTPDAYPEIYSFVVGGGGAFPTSNGVDSTFESELVEVEGGGYGGKGGGTSGNNGASGGCGGGAGRMTITGYGGSGSLGGSGGDCGTSSTYVGAGGGGMGGDGQTDGYGAASGTDGYGGASIDEQLTGTGIQICGGGAGSSTSTSHRSLPGGGTTSPNYSGGKGGNYTALGIGEDGNAGGGYGGGGGGGQYSYSGTVGDGGDGALIIRWRYQN